MQTMYPHPAPSLPQEAAGIGRLVCRCPIFLATILLAACGDAKPMHQALLPPIQGQEAARAAVAPNVPGPIARNYATMVVLELEVREQLGSIADGVEYPLWTYGERAPGPFFRVREGDLVEVHLHNHPD